LAAELAAAKERRSLSSFIEMAVEEHANNVKVTRREHDDEFRWVSATQVADAVWDVDEADRFVKLALAYPELLTLEEQRLWKLIREWPYLWRGHKDDAGEWRYQASEKTLIFKRLREHWDTLVQVSRGELPASKLIERE
jgi:hypothetical protein